MEPNYYFDANQTKNDLVQWIDDYFKQNAAPTAKAVIGISGGKDSSIAAALCKEALGRERVLGILMPQGQQADIAVSYRLCQTLEIPYWEINIQTAVRAIYDELEKNGQILNSIVTSNTPARVRMSILYAMSAMVGGRVVNTSNLSEDWVGYATKFGDTAGDFSPLSRLTMTEVKAVGRELGLAAMFVDKVPLDGLSGKTDEDNLGFTYAALDRYIREQVCANDAVKARIDTLYRQNRHKLEPMPSFPFSPGK